MTKKDLSIGIEQTENKEYNGFDEYILEELKNISEESHRDFIAKLVPNVEKEKILGIRNPNLRKLAKTLFKKVKKPTEDDIKKGIIAQQFIKNLPHYYHEENNLHSMMFEYMDDIDEIERELESYLPYVDNWASCDIIKIKMKKEWHEKFLPYVMKCLESEYTYVVRFGIVSLLTYYLDDYYKEGIIETVSSIKSDEYYINMAIAWFMSYAIIKKYDIAIKVIESGSMDKFVHNKSIQKSIESFRVSDERKKYLKTLRK